MPYHLPGKSQWNLINRSYNFHVWHHLCIYTDRLQQTALGVDSSTNTSIVEGNTALFRFNDMDIRMQPMRKNEEERHGARSNATPQKCLLSPRMRAGLAEMRR